MENLSDKIASLSARCGQFGIAKVVTATADDDTWANWSADATGAAATWTENQKNGAGVGGHGFTEFSTPAIFDVTYSTRDVIDVTVSLGNIITTSVLDLQLFLLLQDYGVAATFAAATKLVGGAVHLANAYNGPVILRGRRAVSGFTRGKYAQVFLGAKSVAGANPYTLAGDHALFIKVMRNALVMP
jgi:hypothetical protein